MAAYLVLHKKLQVLSAYDVISGQWERSNEISYEITHHSEAEIYISFGVATSYRNPATGKS